MRDTIELIGRRVRARTKDGPVTGTVQDVLTREQAEKKLGIRGSDKLHKGNYLVISGVSYPIRRARCKVVD